MLTNNEMPELPKPTKLRRQIRSNGAYEMVAAYTDQEMHDYARAVLAAAQAKNGTTCQTYGHWVDAPCAECNAVDPLTEGGPALAGWQPIETAPKDGARVLTFRYGFLESFAVAWFNNSGWRPVHGSSWPHPTHWMPLPTAPSPEGGAS